MKIKKILAVAAAAVLLVSTASMPAGAVSSTWTLTKQEYQTYSATLGLYNYGNVEYLRNSASSDDGVNLYLDYSIPGNGWTNKIHLFADPGKSDSATGNYKAPSKSSWRGNMKSWWPTGRNCAAEGKIHAYN